MDTSVTFTLDGQSTTMTYADIIWEAAVSTGISPYSIAIKIIQEVGTNGSSSVSGTYSGYEGYYNFFNIGASDSGNAIENGLAYAKEKGWDNQYKAIVEGAEFLADSYINAGQNTAYFYKFDVVSDTKTGTFWHQYMTNVQDPSSQASRLYNTYVKNNIEDASLNFIIPVFEDMPTYCGLPSSIDETASSSYYVNGVGVNLRSSPTTSSSSIATLTTNEIVTVEELAVTTADGYTWAKITRANGTTGYVANKYLTACNEATIAKIEDAYIIVAPNREKQYTVSEIASELGITSYTVTDKNGETVDNNSNISTSNLIYNKTEDKSYTIVLLGDVNGDGDVDVIDLAIVKRYLVGNYTLTEEYERAGILQTGNTEIDVIDLALLKRFLTGTDISI